MTTEGSERHRRGRGYAGMFLAGIVLVVGGVLWFEGIAGVHDTELARSMRPDHGELLRTVEPERALPRSDVEDIRRLYPTPAFYVAKPETKPVPDSDPINTGPAVIPSAERRGLAFTGYTHLADVMEGQITDWTTGDARKVRAGDRLLDGTIEAITTREIRIAFEDRVGLLPMDKPEALVESFQNEIVYIDCREDGEGELVGVFLVRGDVEVELRDRAPDNVAREHFGVYVVAGKSVAERYVRTDGASLQEPGRKVQFLHRMNPKVATGWCDMMEGFNLPVSEELSSIIVARVRVEMARAGEPVGVFVVESLTETMAVLRYGSAELTLNLGESRDSEALLRHMDESSEVINTLPIQMVSGPFRLSMMARGSPFLLLDRPEVYEMEIPELLSMYDPSNGTTSGAGGFSRFGP